MSTKIDTSDANHTRTRQVRPKYQVFVSSTFTDLRSEREAVTWEILKAGHIPVGMENFSAEPDRGWKVINRTLETTDYYILILAGRYGSIDPDLGISWTEREYRRALELGIPVLTFTRDKKSIPGDQMDMDEKAKKLESLVAEINKNWLRETWTTADDLRAKVSLALLKRIAEDEAEGTTRPGWYRGNQFPSPAIVDELARLSAENRNLRARLADDPQTAVARAQAELLPRITPNKYNGISGSPDRYNLSFNWNLRNAGGTPFEVVALWAQWRFTDATRKILDEGGFTDLIRHAEHDREVEVRMTDKIVGAGDKQLLTIDTELNEKDGHIINHIREHRDRLHTYGIKTLKVTVRVTVQNRITRERETAEAEDTYTM